MFSELVGRPRILVLGADAQAFQFIENLNKICINHKFEVDACHNAIDLVQRFDRVRGNGQMFRTFIPAVIAIGSHLWFEVDGRQTILPIDEITESLGDLIADYKVDSFKISETTISAAIERVIKSRTVDSEL